MGIADVIELSVHAEIVTTYSMGISQLQNGVLLNVGSEGNGQTVNVMGSSELIKCMPNLLAIA